MLLEKLCIWDDTRPRSGPLNMALDEAMMEQAVEPWLRIYRWSEPTLSIGFSQTLKVIPESKRKWPVVRRWTGGGLVVHDGDWTYTLAVPANHPFGEQSAGGSYRQIHEAMIAALAASGIEDCLLQTVSTSDGMGVCFTEPARFDVVRNGQKIAGAAQRRSRVGFLHQGTVQPLQPPSGFAWNFARALALEPVVIAQVDAERRLLDRAQILCSEKYRTDSWLHERRAVTEKSSVIPAA
ncbi:MAG: hypothetical protein WCN98_13290 [Verrucomicrobiaceae bacterium]